MALRFNTQKKMNIKTVVKNLAGPKLLGIFDYFSKPEYKNIWGGAFNGQAFRCAIFEELCETISFNVIIETGTFRGNTTAFVANKQLPVYTVESDSRNYGYVLARFLFKPRIHTIHNDSRAFLKVLAEDKDFPKDKVFFYLDAHWDKELPLREELDIIFATWRESVVMVDDFKVPRTKYQYDDYGEGKALTIEYLQTSQHSNDFQLFFPAKGDEHETGFKRGCVVLTNSPKCARRLSAMQTLSPTVPRTERRGAPPHCNTTAKSPEPDPAHS